ncbi:Gustatory receptor 63a [Carabus blaptoides fortunei]
MANFGASNRIAVLGVGQLNQIDSGLKKQAKGVYLDVQPATPPHLRPKDAFGLIINNVEVAYGVMKPMIMLLKIMGMLPMSRLSRGRFAFQVASAITFYSLTLYATMIGYIVYIQLNQVKVMKSSEGKFEEAAIDYLFITYLIPIIAVPLLWYETNRIADCYNLWSEFERAYRRVNNRKLELSLGAKSIAIPVLLTLIASGSMLLIHMSMVDYHIVQIIPYCYVNSVTYFIGGYWYLMCLAIATVATNVANDFQKALKNVGPSSKVAEYRSLWLRLTKITRDTGVSLCYTMIFLCLYLFMTITLSIYGLISQIQAGFGLKDIGLAITAIFSIALLFFICDMGHFASQNVRDNFQKKLLLVELSWMNDDAQHEISMFLRATEMNPTDLSLGGFFDVNRNLFKSLMATMVTYLVVLLQFQISLPDSTKLDEDDMANTTAIITLIA